MTTKMLSRKVNSKLILNIPKQTNKIQKLELEILFGLTYHSTKHYPRMLQNFFFNWSTDVLQSLIYYKKFSTEIQWRLVTAVWKIYSKYKKSIIVRLHSNRVTKWHYVTVVQKKNFPWVANAKLWTQFMTVISLHQSRKKSTLG